jgi:hypothetical protein
MSIKKLKISPKHKVKRQNNKITLKSKKANKMHKLSYKKKYLKVFPSIIVVTLLAIVIIYVAFTSSKTSTVGFYFSTASTSVKSGDILTVQVRLNEPKPIDTVQVYIHYSSNLEIVEAPTIEEPYESEFENDISTAGLIKIQRSDFSDILSTDDRLISKITFKAKSAGEAAFAFTDDTYGVNEGTIVNNINKTSTTYLVGKAK